MNCTWIPFEAKKAKKIEKEASGSGRFSLTTLTQGSNDVRYLIT